MRAPHSRGPTMRFSALVMSVRSLPRRFAVLVVLCAALPALAAPRVVLISLDGGTPRLVEEFMRDGTIPHDRGLGLLAHVGGVADRNTTVNPSLTAPGHIGIATGSTAAQNDVPSNTFHLV